MWFRNGGGAGGYAGLSVRGLIAGGMSTPDGAGGAETMDPLQEDTPTAVTVEDELADGEDIDALGDMAAAAFSGCDNGGRGATGPSLTDIILAALVAAELRLPPPPRPDAERIE